MQRINRKDNPIRKDARIGVAPAVRVVKMGQRLNRCPSVPVSGGQQFRQVGSVAGRVIRRVAQRAGFQRRGQFQQLLEAG